MRSRASEVAARRAVIALALLVAAALAVPGPAAARQPYAPLDRPGPALSVPRAELRASLRCTGDLHHARRTPVLLLSGTTVDSDENFAWNWMPALSAAGYPWCAVDAPGDNMGDIQVRGEYVTNAIRRMYRRSGRRIALYGHSQGGMVGRWSLRFWPGIRKMVGDVVGAAPSNQGTDTAVGVCAVPCAASFWQQRSGSKFIRALNSRAETFAGIAYTNVYSHFDEVVIPNADDSGRSSLHTGDGEIANIAAQGVCPLNLSDHLLLGTVDPLTWALFVDAVEHPGPADPGRIGADVCDDRLMPGVDRATYTTDLVASAVALANAIAIYPRVAAEPPLRDYVFAR